MIQSPNYLLMLMAGCNSKLVIIFDELFQGLFIYFFGYLPLRYLEISNLNLRSGQENLFRCRYKVAEFRYKSNSERKPTASKLFFEPKEDFRETDNSRCCFHLFSYSSIT